MKTNKFMTAIMAVGIVAVTSCDKGDSSETIDTSNLNPTESITLDATTEEIESTLETYTLYATDYITFDTLGSKGVDGKRHRDRAGFFADCADIVEETFDTTSTTTITFPADCEDKNGDLISGAITIVKSTSDTDKSRAITFEDFTINGFVVNGTKSHSYTAVNANGNPQADGSRNLTFVTDEGTITKTGTRSIEITSGGDTDTHKDDEKTYTGSYTLTDAEGNTKTVEITTPLVKPADCMHISSGTKLYTENDEVSSLDYGDGTCDTTASTTAADGTVTEIELKRKRKGRNK